MLRLGLCSVKEDHHFHSFTDPSLFFPFNIKPVLGRQPWFSGSTCSSRNAVLAEGHSDSIALCFPSPGMTFSEWSWTMLREMRCSTARWARSRAAMRDALFRNDWCTENKRVAGCDLQKRTWESNKNDIRICRMKGKHEVRDLYSCYCGS